MIISDSHTELFRAGFSNEEVHAKTGLPLSTVERYRRAYNAQIDGEPITPRLPKILLFDIETLPMWVRVWGLYKQRIPHKNIIKDWIILSWSAKWLDDKTVWSEILTPQEAVSRNDYRICQSLWRMLNNADIIIAHNLLRFDQRKVNAKFLYYSLLPPAPYQTIDTLKEFKKLFSCSSYALDWLGKTFISRGKIDTNYELWIDCEEGKQKALDDMLDYNIVDVLLLEKAYKLIRSWIKSHPNLGLYYELESPRCPNCGSTNIWADGEYVTPANSYVAMRCECGAIGRIRSSLLTTGQRNKLIRSVAR